MGDVQSRRGGAFRAIGLSLAGLAVALAVVGCWHDWSTTSQIARDFHTATLLPDGRVLIAGGNNWDLMTVAASAELYDPATGTFSPTGSMTAARAAHTATLLADGRVLVTGGEYLEGTNWGYLSSAELYDPKTGKFSPTGPMGSARWRHSATLLSDGRVLITGGYAGSTLLASAELYDPKTGIFSPTGSMAAALGDHTATALSDGRVLIVGTDASAELYDPKTGIFSPTGSMGTAQDGHTATQLSDGRVLIVGVDAIAELYDPATGTFSPTGSMTTARRLYTATLLSDGRVLVAGGSTGVELGGDLASAELYDPKTGTFSLTGSLTTTAP